MTTENTATRLQETAAKCLSSLDAWNNDLKDRIARENLLEAVHELRKVTSRLEIDIVMNDRKAVNAKTIPIPEHKSKTEKRTQKPLSEILPVAEIKEANKRKKIEIAAANDKNKDNADANANANANAESDTPPNKDAEESSAAPKKRVQRRPRRPKREDNGDSNEE